MAHSRRSSGSPSSGGQVTGDDVEAVRSTWETGYSVLVWRLNGHLTELFPSCPGMRLAADEPSTNHGLQHYYLIFREALPATLFSRIPMAIQLRRERPGKPTEQIAKVPLRDHERPFPWCIGLAPLGTATGNLDEEYLDIVHRLRTSGHDAQWFEENVVKPTRAHASVWRGLFEQWQRVYGFPGPLPYRLSVDVDSLTVTLNQKSYHLNCRSEALFLEMLLRRPGDWRSAPDMAKKWPELEGVRLDRLEFCEPIKRLIESKPGSGYRLRTSVDES